MNGERKCGLYIHAYKCVFIMEYYSAIKNEILPFATSWIDLEGIIYSMGNTISTVSFHGFLMAYFSVHAFPERKSVAPTA